MRHSINPTKHLSTQELENLKTTLEDHKKSSPRDVALLTAALYTGARATHTIGGAELRSELFPNGGAK